MQGVFNTKIFIFVHCDHPKSPPPKKNVSIIKVVIMFCDQYSESSEAVKIIVCEEPTG